MWKTDPIFYAALAHTDNLAYFTDAEGCKRERVSTLNLLPRAISENVLFSMSFDSDIHYDSQNHLLDPNGVNERLLDSRASPRRLFADCGAFQYVDLETPMIDEVEVDANLAWKLYKQRHIDVNYKWDSILLCSPDHIVSQDMDDKSTKSRLEFTQNNAEPFLELSKSIENVTAVGVIHGRNPKERVEQYEYFKKLGYEYVALGGMVPHATDLAKVLHIIAGIKDPEHPLIDKSSILARCRNDGIKLHIFGLNSLDYVRWWHRLDIDSFDGSKLSTEGAANGWYYVPNDGKGLGRDYPTTPSNANELFQRISVKKTDFENWKWSWKSLMSNPDVPLTNNEVDTTCECPACQYLTTARCTSNLCWLWNEGMIRYRWRRHTADPRMMGSTEHNMGRTAHNAYVFAWVMDEIKRLHKRANLEPVTSDNSWLKHWKRIPMEEEIHVFIPCSKSKSEAAEEHLIWDEHMEIDSWTEAWQSSEKTVIVEELYTGRSFKRIIECINGKENVHGYVVSAGAGLVSLGTAIPSYESTFKDKQGPKQSDWSRLPLGGLENLDLGPRDIIVSFLPPDYHKAVLNDPMMEHIESRMYILSTSKTPNMQSFTKIEIHPKSSKALKVAMVDINSHFVEMFLNSGIASFNHLRKKAKKLKNEKKRTKINDDDLLHLVTNLHSKMGSAEMLKHIRVGLNIQVSKERLTKTLVKIQGEQ